MSDARKRCCPVFEHALEDGTDQEGFGPLIREYDEFVIGKEEELPPIKFCPWCGARIEAKPEHWE